MTDGPGWKNSEGQGRVLFDIFHDEEGTDLPDTRKCDQHLAVQSVEIGHVPHTDFEQIVKISRHKVTFQQLLYS